VKANHSQIEALLAPEYDSRLCDGGVGSGHGMAQSSIPSAKLGQSSNCGMAQKFAACEVLHLNG